MATEMARECLEGLAGRVRPLERPVQFLQVLRLTHVYICLEQTHDYRHGRLVATKAAQSWDHHVQVHLGWLT